MTKTIHTNKAADNALTEATHMAIINRTGVSESRKARAQKKLDEYYATRQLEGVWVAAGDTFKAKDELKKAGFSFCGGARIWWTRTEPSIKIDGVEFYQG